MRAAELRMKGFPIVFILAVRVPLLALGSPIFIAASGRPFNLLLSFDANGDGRSQSDRPGAVGATPDVAKPSTALTRGSRAVSDSVKTVIWS